MRPGGIFNDHFRRLVKRNTVWLKSEVEDSIRYCGWLRTPFHATVQTPNGMIRFLCKYQQAFWFQPRSNFVVRADFATIHSILRHPSCKPCRLGVHYKKLRFCYCYWSPFKTTKGSLMQSPTQRAPSDPMAHLTSIQSVDGIHLVSDPSDISSILIYS